VRVLVIDTALNACTAAVFEDDRPLGVRSEAMAKGHQERIGGLVRDAVADAEKSGAGGFDAIDRIGVTVGPGSFTGLRVGLAFAQGLGAALGVPVVGISTLAGLARTKQDEWSAKGIDAPDIAAAIDARRGQVYIQIFRDGVSASPPRALTIDAAGADFVVVDGSWSFVGSGAALILESLPPPSPGVRSGDRERHAEEVRAGLITVPSPEALAALTIAADPESAPPTPLYLRAPTPRRRRDCRDRRGP
jgi:tRNA threonylcarbamoyladenosine biosynthesis protein TsaB